VQWKTHTSPWGTFPSVHLESNTPTATCTHFMDHSILQPVKQPPPFACRKRHSISRERVDTSRDTPQRIEAMHATSRQVSNNHLSSFTYPIPSAQALMRISAFMALSRLEVNVSTQTSTNTTRQAQIDLRSTQLKHAKVELTPLSHTPMQHHCMPTNCKCKVNPIQELHSVQSYTISWNNGLG
jgi:hypothetical protein